MIGRLTLSAKAPEPTQDRDFYWVDLDDEVRFWSGDQWKYSTYNKREILQYAHDHKWDVQVEDRRLPDTYGDF